MSKEHKVNNTQNSPIRTNTFYYRMWKTLRFILSGQTPFIHVSGRLRSVDADAV